MKPNEDNVPLTDAEKLVLEKGLKFIPTPRRYSRGRMRSEFERFCRTYYNAVRSTTNCRTMQWREGLSREHPILPSQRTVDKETGTTNADLSKNAKQPSEMTINKGPAEAGQALSIFFQRTVAQYLLSLGLRRKRVLEKCALYYGADRMGLQRIKRTKNKHKSKVADDTEQEQLTNAVSFTCTRNLRTPATLRAQELRIGCIRRIRQIAAFFFRRIESRLIVVLRTQSVIVLSW